MGWAAALGVATQHRTGVGLSGRSEMSDTNVMVKRLRAAIAELKQVDNRVGIMDHATAVTEHALAKSAALSHLKVAETMVELVREELKAERAYLEGRGESDRS